MDNLKLWMGEHFTSYMDRGDTLIHRRLILNQLKKIDFLPCW